VIFFRLWAALVDFSGHFKASVSFFFLFPSHSDNNLVDVESFNCYTGYSPLPVRPSRVLIWRQGRSTSTEAEHVKLSIQTCRTPTDQTETQKRSCHCTALLTRNRVVVFVILSCRNITNDWRSSTIEWATLVIAGYHLKKEGIYNDQIFGGFYTPCSYNLRAGTKWPIDDVDRIGHWGVGHFILPLQQPIAFLDTRLDALEIFLAAVPPALFPYSSTIACAVAR
jgi:hypothetical protein